MIAIEQVETWVSPIEIRDLFEGTEYGRDGQGADASWDAVDADPHAQSNSSTGTIVDAMPVEIDEELGLAIVPQETILSKYGVQLYPSENTFHQSLTAFFERKGYLTPKQLSAIRDD